MVINININQNTKEDKALARFTKYVSALLSIKDAWAIDESTVRKWVASSYTPNIMTDSSGRKFIERNNSSNAKAFIRVNRDRSSRILDFVSAGGFDKEAFFDTFTLTRLPERLYFPEELLDSSTTELIDLWSSILAHSASIFTVEDLSKFQQSMLDSTLAGIGVKLPTLLLKQIQEDTAQILLNSQSIKMAAKSKFQAILDSKEWMSILEMFDNSHSSRVNTMDRIFGQEIFWIPDPQNVKLNLLAPAMELWPEEIAQVAAVNHFGDKMSISPRFFRQLLFFQKMFKFKLGSPFFYQWSRKEKGLDFHFATAHYVHYLQQLKDEEKLKSLLDIYLGAYRGCWLSKGVGDSMNNYHYENLLAFLSNLEAFYLLANLSKEDRKSLLSLVRKTRSELKRMKICYKWSLFSLQ